MGNSEYISEEDLFHYLAGCPFFETYRDEETDKMEKILTSFFRNYQMRRMTERPVRYQEWLNIFNKYLIAAKLEPHDMKRLYPKCRRYFTNFYALFHPSKKYKVLFPYFPYIYKPIKGCSEVVLESSNGVRLYCYDYSDQGVGPEELNRYGFRLQTAARIFHLQTGKEPSSMAVAFPSSKTVVYYTYNPEEKIEEMVGQVNTMVRRYGSYCADCTQQACKPLIDRTDRYGWSIAEHEDNA